MRQPIALILLSLTLLSWPAAAQFSQQGPKLLGTGAAGNEEEGYSVSLSADDNTAIVGAPEDNGGAGAAWIWTRSGDIWTQKSAKLVGSDAVGKAAQGSSVSISADGNTVLIGGPADNNDSGAAWIWTRNGDSWIQQPGGKLIALNPTGLSRQGSSVSLSADGNKAIVGGPSDGNNAGAAWIWTRIGATWSQQKLVGTGALGSPRQGGSVALSADGNTAIVGGKLDNFSTGAAWIWIRNGGSWIQQGNKLVGAGAVGAPNQGSSVALSADGNTAIIGATGDRNGGGAASIWTRNFGVWTEQPAKLVATDGSANSQQGISVSLSADGKTAIIGGYLDNTIDGAAWIWTLSGGVWTQLGTKLVGSGAIGKGLAVSQGWSVSLSGDGNTAVVGGFLDNRSAGAAWIWIRSPGGWTQQGSKLVGTGAAANTQQGSSVALSADGNTAIVGGFLDSNGLGAAWVWTRNNGVWTQQGAKLTASDPIGNSQQGFSVALSADGNTAVIGAKANSSNSGGGWIWTRSGGVWTQETELTDGFGVQLGYSSALSPDGNTVMLGAPAANNLAGAAYVWVRVAGGWKAQGIPPNALQPQPLSSPDAIGSAQQGSAVSLSADGNTAIVGGLGDNNHDGAAWVWTRSGGFWTKQSKLVGFGAIGHAQQGTSVSISADGNTAIVGGPNDDDGAGAAWVWTRSGGTWSQQTKLVSASALGKASQGWSVSLSADGNTAIVGGFRDNTSAGAAWVWTRSGGVWTEHPAKLTGSAAAGNANQGWSVFLSADGSTAILGGPLDNNQAGAVWIFTAPPQRRRASRH